MDADADSVLQEWWHPNESKIETNLELFRGDYAGQLAARLGRAEASVTPHANVQLAAMAMHLDFISRSLGMMFIGIALYTWGVFTSAFGKRLYWSVFLVGVGCGVPIASYSLYQHYSHDWGWHYSMFPGRALNHIATLFLALGYTSGVMLWSQSHFAVGFRTQLASMGRMALTNYIGQSILATTVFYGFGLGLYGYLSRLEQLFVVIAILFVQCTSSSWWLARFKVGPLEWIWRIASYWKLFPLRV